MVNVEAEKRDIERSIVVETQRMAETVKSEYALAKARLEAMDGRCVRRRTSELDNDDAVKLRELERTAAVNKTYLRSFAEGQNHGRGVDISSARRPGIIMPAQQGGRLSQHAKVL